MLIAFYLMRISILVVEITFSNCKAYYHIIKIDEVFDFDVLYF